MADETIDTGVKPSPAPEAVPAPVVAPPTAPAPTESPVQAEPPPAGEETATPAITPDADADVEHPKLSTEALPPGVKKTIGSLRQDRRELKEENRRLQAQLQKSMGNPLATLTGQRKPEETAAYWKKMAAEATDEQTRQQASQKYWEVLPQDIESQAVGRVVQAVQQAQQHQVLSQKLTEIHERTPIFEPNGTIDMKSPVVQRALQLATEQGIVLANGNVVNWRGFEYVAREASWEMQGQSAQSREAALDQQRVQTLRATARTGLETSSAPATTQPSGSKVNLEKEIAALEKQKAGLGMRIDIDLNTRLGALRNRLRDSLRQPAKR